MSEFSARALADVEARRHEAREEFGLERELSINDWIDRIRSAAQQAHAQARLEGAEQAQYETFVEIAAMAVGRAEVLLAVMEEE